MTKRTYIQPISETMVLPKGVLMDDVQAASGGSFPGGSSTTPTLPSNPGGDAPKRQKDLFY